MDELVRQRHQTVFLVGQPVDAAPCPADGESRAGRDDVGRELFAFAEAQACSESGSDALLAYVRRERAQRLREQGRRFASLRARAAAAAAEWRPGRRR